MRSCSRCEGHDPNCWMCHEELDKEDDPNFDLDAAYNLSIEDDL